jgi:hypothetical protein
MRSWIFAAAATSLLGLIGFSAACTVTPVEPQQTYTAADGGADASKDREDAAADGAGEPNACVPTTVTAAELKDGTKPPTASNRGSCTQAEIDEIVALIGNENAEFQAVSDAIKGSCRACLVQDYSPTADPKEATNWAPLLVFSDSGDGADVTAIEYYDAASCAGALGLNADCARGLQAEENCPDFACAECAAGTNYDACIDASLGTVAKPGICTSAPDKSKCDAAALKVYDEGCNDAAGDVDKTTAKRLLAACGPGIR